MIYLITNQTQLFSSFKKASYADLFEWIKDKKYIGLDCETTGFDPYTCKLLSVQIGNKDAQFVVDVGSGIDIQPIRFILESKEYIKLGANLKFDSRFFLHNNINLTNIYDVFLAECVLTTGLKDRHLGLDAMAWKYLTVKLDKTVRGEISYKGLTDRVIKYAAADVEHLEDIMDKQLVEINKHNLINTLNLENEVSIAFAKMEYNGIYLNKTKWLELASKAEKLVFQGEKELDKLLLLEPKLSKFCKSYQADLFDSSFEKKSSVKWSSPLQCKEVFTELGLDIESTSEKDINKYSKQYPIINAFIEFKKTQKLTTTYGKKFLENINKVSGKVHTNVWQVLETGRISTGGHGSPNMQNLPAKNEYLNCFEAGKDMKFVAIDFSGQELRLIAEFSQDPLWLDAFRQGKDLHGELAALTFNVPIEQVRDKPKFLRGKSYRDVQKTINFGLAYGMSEFKLSKTLDIPVEDAKSFIDKYFSIVPQVQKFLHQLGTIGKTKYRIKTSPPFSRIRWFENIEHLKKVDWRNYFVKMGEIERASYNTPIQGSGADITKQAIIYCEEEATKVSYNSKFILQIHDAIMYSVPSQYAEEWSKIQDNCMKRAAKLVIKTIPVETDITITDVWTK